MKFLFFLVLPIFSFALPVRQIALGEALLKVEIAAEKKSQDRGLMFRTELPEGRGMLFIYQKPERLSFWMKNTYIPLSIGFFDAEGTLLNIEDMAPYQEGEPLRLFKSKALAVYALEVPQGWFARQNIRPGAKFSFRDP